MSMLKPAGLKIYMMSHITFFVMLAFLWIVVSYAGGKMKDWPWPDCQPPHPIFEGTDHQPYCHQFCRTVALRPA